MSQLENFEKSMQDQMTGGPGCLTLVKIGLRSSSTSGLGSRRTSFGWCGADSAGDGSATTKGGANGFRRPSTCGGGATRSRGERCGMATPWPSSRRFGALAIVGDSGQFIEWRSVQSVLGFDFANKLQGYNPRLPHQLSLASS
uniref:Uncharacterized protein n=1 Tax=Oryza barthii TaxID=65489 RepID=A0A0D3EP43_9ORYZ